MALSFIAASSGNNGGGATTLVLSVPASTLDGDIMIATVTVRGGTGTTITAPAGWNLIRRVDSTTTLAAQATYWRKAASEPASYTWTISSNKASGGIETYRGVNQTTPIDAENGQANASATNITAPSITTTANGAMLVGAFGIANDSAVTKPPTMIERYTNASTGGSASTRTRTESADESQASAGATRTRAATAATAAVDIGHLAALKPVAAQSVAPSGLATAFAAGVVALTLFISPAGLPSGEQAGTPRINLAIAAAGLRSAGAAGTPTISTGGAGRTISPTGLASAETAGAPRLALGIAPAGAAAGEAAGAPRLALKIAPAGLGSVEAAGTPRLNLAIATAGLSSVEQAGIPAIATGGHIVEPAGLSTAEASGMPTIANKWDAMRALLRHRLTMDWREMLGEMGRRR